MRALCILAFALLASAAALPALGQGRSCAAEIGRRDATVLADQCRQVSPATRPPCNPSNACALIRSEIERGCEMLGSDAPDFCPTTDDDDEED